MKLSRFLIIIIAASTSFLTACTSEEEEASARHELVFQLGVGNAETRATPEGTWTVGDFIAVKVGNTVKQYIITSSDGKAKGIDTDNTFYWEDFSESSIKVTAWSFGSDYYESLPSAITVKTDQRSDENFTASDFLYAKEMTITKGAPINLTFYHQMTCLGFHINVSEPVDVNSVVIGGDPDLGEGMPFVKVNYSAPTEDVTTGRFPDYGQFVIDYDDENITGTIIAHEGNPVGDAQTFTAILIPLGPKDVYESLPVFITLEDGTMFSLTLGIDVNSPQCEAGGRQFYTINIKNKKLSVGSVAGGPAVTAADWQ